MLFLLDAGALINSVSFSFEKGNQYITTPYVDVELKDFKSKLLAQQAIEQGLLSIEAPKQEFLIKANEKLAETNSRISKTDVSVFALALQLKSENKKFTVITDDYSIQNALLKEKINFEDVLRGKIKRPIAFKKK